MDTSSGQADRLALIDALRAQLDTAKIPLNAEIRAYPVPIAGCDVQYQALLDQRTAISRDLASLNAIADANGLADFIESAVSLDPSTKTALRNKLC